ncbi:patatin-like phospholipase family protein [Niabella ginsengisoli]|uniref:Patatin-like phospholipase family protein n=1 Tax=Niabella ginsengisoli TaxID=522298 RepID=A0ABS9SPK7_9BACT|nr:patatin-like phospholipase family protein [Niabella ginsengisoli]MCH5600310.1 patatin-like phospholipase family protein [Niabella ginsengisoli]
MPASKITVTDFTNSPKVQANLKKLRETFGPNGKPFEVSDVLDAEGHQYVNLVQKGGGVLGVALVGYTYILEKMGIRFLRMAGTSAGAINTAMLTVIGKKQEEKSTRVLEAITNLNFFDLVDGHRMARWIIKRFITHKNYFRRIRIIAIAIIALFTLLLAGSMIFLILGQNNENLQMVSRPLIFALVIVMIVIAELVRYILKLLKKFKTSGYGINPGNFFYNWIEKQMRDNGVLDTTDIINKATQAIPGLHLRHDHPQGITDLTGDVTFIASELVTQNKIEFPAMAGLFRKDKDSLHPAGFVRASMSIPMFFESYFINDIPCNQPSIRQKWKEIFDEDDPPSSTRFVDGGILSNFPINIFYNSKINVPRLPSFGIDLDDSAPEDKKSSQQTGL